MAPSSTNGIGAASAAPIAIPEGATPALVDRMAQAAADAIEDVDNAEAAEALLDQVTVAEHAIRLAKISAEHEARWAGLRLRAERRYGELLGPATTGGQRKGHVSGANVEGTERLAQHQARKVAAVPAADFEAYVAGNPRPTRSGLLRSTAPRPSPRKRKTDTSPAEALDRLRARIKQVRELDARVRPRWTLEDAEHVELVARHLLKRRPKYSGRRLRELATKRRNGHELAALQYRMMQLTSILESVDVADYDLADPEAVSEFHDDLVELQFWMDRSISLASSRLDDVKLLEKLRIMRDPTGRTEAERRTANAIAAKIERRRHNRLDV